MVESFIIALREGVEAALVIAIALGYLSKIGRPDLHRVVYRALGAAAVASLAGAYWLQKLQWNQEAFEGWTLLASAVFVFTLVVWMWRHSKGLRAHIESRLGEASAGSRAAVGVFLFVFLMVFREGVETVLLLSAVDFNTESILEAGGLVLGLALAVAFGVTFVRGTVRIDLRRFFRITTMILLVVVLQLAITGLHELSEARVLPSSEREMAVIGPIVRNDVFFFVTVLALAAWMVLLEWRRRRDAPAAQQAAGAARRKAEWTARRERLWMNGVCTASFVFILLITAEFIYAKTATALSPAAPVTALNGQIRIRAASVSDGTLHRFSYRAGDTTMRLIVIRRPDQTLVAALDACLICGDQGYFQKGPHVMCKNCDSAISIPSIGLEGGCNPIAVRSRVEGAELVIEAADLEAGSKHFRRG
jgi:FTR1 family protein